MTALAARANRIKSIASVAQSLFAACSREDSVCSRGGFSADDSVRAGKGGGEKTTVTEVSCASAHVGIFCGANTDNDFGGHFMNFPKGVAVPI